MLARAQGVITTIIEAPSQDTMRIRCAELPDPQTPERADRGLRPHLDDRSPHALFAGAEVAKYF